MKNFYTFNLLLAVLLAVAALATYEPAPKTSGAYGIHVDSYEFQNAGDAAPPIAIPDYATLAHPGDSTASGPDEAAKAAVLTPAFQYRIGSVRLFGREGSRPFAAELSVAGLTEATLPPLDQGMVNVTGDATGYRMLPDGMVFNEDISIVLPYDSTLLPAGYTPNDIVTYYYDVAYGRWIAIERDSVSEAEALVYSKVNHFTDFINAVIKTPEMPETSAFTPTSIKELEAANPLEGLQLIQAPTANNSGTANLSYQLEIPPGRQGMQPNLALTYNSGGGNGWLGVGWDISVPAITVDTRWGVPRYESEWESEVYIYGGEQLVTMTSDGAVRKMPHRTNRAGQTGRLPDGEQFYARAGEAHDSIVRHGINPTNYWWEVVDRNGNTSYYGAYPPCDTTHGPTRIGGANGIARWALAATVDPNGNMVKYHYSIEHNAGAGGEMGRQLYLDSISYTGYLSFTDSIVTDGLYTVVFNRNDFRTDIITNGRNGFKEVTAATLCNIQVKFRDELVRTFFFVTDYSRASNFKTRLEHLIRVDDTVTLDLILQATQGSTCIGADTYGDIVRKTPIVHYDFEYFDYPEAGTMFSDPIEQHLDGENISSFFRSATVEATALGATKSKSWSLGGTFAFGINPRVFKTDNSFGGNFGYNRSKSNGLLMMIDLDGDGLADKVYKRGNQVYYRKQIRDDENHFHFSDGEVRLEGVSDFLLETSNNIDFGLQVSISVLAASNGSPITTSTTTNYFADINGDGRPDLVTKDGPYFNCLKSNGDVEFLSARGLIDSDPPDNASLSAIVFSDNVCDTFFYDGYVDPYLECSDEDTLIHTMVFNYLAGTSGNASWGGSIIQAGDTAFTLAECRYVHHGNEQYIYQYCPDPDNPSEWIETKLSLEEWTPWMDIDFTEDSIVYVGDIQYHKEDGSGKVYQSIPVITPQSCGLASPDPDIDAVRVWIAPMDGTVKITSKIRLLPDSSGSRQQARYVDGVSYMAQHSHGIGYDTNSYIYHVSNDGHVPFLTSASDDIIFSGLINENDTLCHADSCLCQISKGDILFFDLNSNENHSFDKVEWIQDIKYVNEPSVTDFYGLDKARYNSEKDFLLTGEGYFQAPMDGEVIISGTVHSDSLTRPAKICIIHSNSSYNDTIHIPQGVNFTYTVSGSTALHCQTDSGEIVKIVAMPEIPGQSPNWSALSFDYTLCFAGTFGGVIDTLEYRLPLQYHIDATQISLLQSDTMDMLGTTWSAIACSYYEKMFGKLYRGWGRFGYNNNFQQNHGHVIEISRLALPLAILAPNNIDTTFMRDFDTAQLMTDSAYLANLFDSNNLYNPLSDNTSWVQVQAYPQYNAYMGYGNVTYFSKKIMANTRMIIMNVDDGDEDDSEIIEYESAIPVSTDGFPVKTIRKQNRSASGTGSYGMDVPISQTEQTDVSMSISGTIGKNWIISDYLDMNGDGYPDFLTDKKRQYTMPWGGIGQEVFSDDFGICSTTTRTTGNNFGRSAITPVRELGLNPKGKSISYKGSGSVNANIGIGTDETKISYADINGDGLPDKIKADGNIRLNTGYDFTVEENWGNSFVREGSSENFGVNQGAGAATPSNGTFSSNFDFSQASISGGMGVTVGQNSAKNVLMDMNGDGMPDKVMCNGSGISAQYNLGNGSWSSSDFIGGCEISSSTSYSESLST